MDWVRGFALALGGPGLFVIAFLDSSFLSFPEVVDVLLVVMSVRHPERMPYYATMATAGSVAGSFLLYLAARKGGDAFLRRRVSASRVEGALQTFRRFGWLAVAVPSVLPPPVPFKLFVLAAGASGVRPLQFLGAITLGRAVRYYGEGLLAIWYGEAAIEFLSRHASTIGIVIAGLFLVGGLGWLIRGRRRPAIDEGAGRPL